jgi:ABC-2 type transport system permease protein
LIAKILPGFILGYVSVLIMVLLAVFMFKMPIWLGLLILLVGWLPVLFTCLTGLLIDVYNPKLDWDSEQKAVKQNVNVLYNMLAGIIPGVLTIILVTFLPSLPTILIVLTALYGLLCYIIAKLLFTQGVKQLIRLEV